MRVTIPLILLVLLSCGPMAAGQTFLNIDNAGFETGASVPDGTISNVAPANWTFCNGSPGSGVANPSTSDFPHEAPEGQHVAVISDDVLEQTLMNPGSGFVPHAIAPGATYCLQMKVGRRASSPVGDYFVDVIVDGTYIASFTNPVVPEAGRFKLASCSFLVDPLSLPGSSVKIAIETESDGSEIWVDDIRLSILNTRHGPAPADVVGGFECDAPGTVPLPGSTCEGWDHVGVQGAAVVPDGGAVTGPVAHLPTDGMQFVELCTANTDGGIPTVSKLELDVYALTNTLALDWVFATTEATGPGAQFIDFFEVRIFDLSSTGFSSVIIDVTFPGFVQGQSIPSAFNGTVYTEALIPTESMRITMPLTVVGNPLRIELIVGNGTDAVAQSSAYVDNIRFESSRVRRPGTGDDLRLATGFRDDVTGAITLSGGPGNDIKSADGRTLLGIDVHDPFTLVGEPLLVIGSVEPNGTAPAQISGLPLWFNIPTAFFLVNGAAATPFGPSQTLLPFGNQYYFSLPTTGLAGTTVLIQAVISSGNTANNIFAATDAHAIVFTN